MVVEVSDAAVSKLMCVYSLENITHLISLPVGFTVVNESVVVVDGTDVVDTLDVDECSVVSGTSARNRMVLHY